MSENKRKEMRNMKVIRSRMDTERKKSKSKNKSFLTFHQIPCHSSCQYIHPLSVCQCVS